MLALPMPENMLNMQGLFCFRQQKKWVVSFWLLKTSDAHMLCMVCLQRTLSTEHTLILRHCPSVFYKLSLWSCGMIHTPWRMVYQFVRIKNNFLSVRLLKEGKVTLFYPLPHSPFVMCITLSVIRRIMEAILWKWWVRLYESLCKCLAGPL